MKYPDDFINKIVCDDVFNVLRYIPNESIELIITSPPYNIELPYDEYDDSMSDGEHKQFNRKWAEEAIRISKDTTRMYVILDDKMIWWFKPLAEEIGWKFVQLLTWCKPNLSRKMGRITGDWNFLSENILLFRKGGRTSMLRSEISNTHNWFVETTPQTNFKKDYQKRVHPAQFPVSLIRKIISRTPGQVVLDPFCGAGSVCIAAKELGRDYIGIDLSGEYCQMARERLDYSANNISTISS
jgi:DNA modification methylase